MLPEQALVPQGEDQHVVFRVVDGKAVRTKVEVGSAATASVEIVNGVATARLIVTAGQLKIRDGVPVAVAPAVKSAASDAPAQSGQNGSAPPAKAVSGTPPPAPKS